MIPDSWLFVIGILLLVALVNFWWDQRRIVRQLTCRYCGHLHARHFEGAWQAAHCSATIKLEGVEVLCGCKNFQPVSPRTLKSGAKKENQ